MTQLTNPIEQAIAQIDEAINDTLQQLAEAAESRALNMLPALTKNVSELEAIKDRLRSLNSPGAPPRARQTTGGCRELVVEVSQGMINQNLLALTEHVKHHRIAIGETLDIEVLPSGDRFQTQLVSPGNKLRERSAIAKFYRDTAVQAGDSVSLHELTAGQWQLFKKRP